MIRVAIDGPAGAGKSTVARAVAEELGAEYLDTGAMYRALALAVLQQEVDPTDGDEVARLLDRCSIGIEDGRVALDGRDVSDAIRTEEVSKTVSVVAAHPEVRTPFVEIQRRLAQRDVVMEGRDIGTVVLPDAEVKVFLTASVDERARRRAAELGDAAGVEEVRAGIAERDERDRHRDVSPLTPAADASVIDTTDMTFDEVVDAIVALADAARARS